MAQRFGRVNRYRTNEAWIDVVYEGKPNEKKQDDPFEQRRWLALQRLLDVRGDASPHALGQLPLSERVAAFTPTPTVLPVSNILFDTWAMTTIPGKLPGRPPVEPYLHGISEWDPPETYVGWREEVGVIMGDLLDKYKPAELLEDYLLKPHELLRDSLPPPPSSSSYRHHDPGSRPRHGLPLRRRAAIAKEKEGGRGWRLEHEAVWGAAVLPPGQQHQRRKRLPAPRPALRPPFLSLWRGSPAPPTPAGAASSRAARRTGAYRIS
jgi:hypothetical protein